MGDIQAVGWARRMPVSAGVREGRDWVRRHLATLGWDEAEPELADGVVLAVSELLTNAHVHAHSDAELVLTWDGHCLRLSVHDHSPLPPRQRTAEPGALGGRGLVLVEAVSDHWDTRPTKEGKTVTACFHPPSAVRGPLKATGAHRSAPPGTG